MICESEYINLKRKRIKVGVIGFAIGVSCAIPITYIFEGVYFSFLTVIIGLIASSVLQQQFERTRDLPTIDDVKAAKFNEDLNPLGIKNYRASKPM